jgi:hypothetical protein
VIFPGQHDSRESHSSHESHAEKPAKLDRWLVGLLAGAALMYFSGKLLGLGKTRPAQFQDDNIRTINNADS